MNKSPQIFGKLVLVCIDSYDSEKRRILQHFSRSTRFAFLCTAQISNLQQKRIEKNWQFFQNISRIIFQNFVTFRTKFGEIYPEFCEMLRNFLRKPRKCRFSENQNSKFSKLNFAKFQKLLIFLEFHLSFHRFNSLLRDEAAS